MVFIRVGALQTYFYERILLAKFVSRIHTFIWSQLYVACIHVSTFPYPACSFTSAWCLHTRIYLSLPGVFFHVRLMLLMKCRIHQCHIFSNARCLYLWKTKMEWEGKRETETDRQTETETDTHIYKKIILSGPEDARRLYYVKKSAGPVHLLLGQRASILTE